MVHDCHYLPVESCDPHLALCRVEGYDIAVYGTPPESAPLLFEHPRGNLMVATTKLSQFVTGRYAPTEAWGPVWRMIDPRLRRRVPGFMLGRRRSAWSRKREGVRHDVYAAPRGRAR